MRCHISCIQAIHVYTTNLIGLPKAEQILLWNAGGNDTRPHGVHLKPRARRLCLYHLFHIRRTDRNRYVCMCTPPSIPPHPLYRLCTLFCHMRVIDCLSFPLDYTICTGCCGSLDHIVTFFFKNLSKKTKGSVPLSPTCHTPYLRLLELHSDMFQQMLSSIMNVMMFENCRCQWSMSRPLLGLILLNEEVNTYMSDHVYMYVHGLYDMHPSPSSVCTCVIRMYIV